MQDNEAEEYVPFSVRQGIEPRKAIQWQSMDAPLRMAIWNVLTLGILHNLNQRPLDQNAYEQTQHDVVTVRMWLHFFDQPFDRFQNWHASAAEDIRRLYFALPWNKVYELLEFLARQDDYIYDSFQDECNRIMLRHNSAYRFISGLIVPVTSDAELSEIERALDATGSTPALKSVATHLRAALKLLSDREHPDYRNSIKESISAVEALCSIVAGKSKAELGSALSTLVARHQFPIHPQFRTALNNLYNYTSDGDGIRHGLMSEPNLDVEDARFMLVSCSAFVNYLIVKADKAGINLSESSN